MVIWLGSCLRFGPIQPFLRVLQVYRWYKDQIYLFIEQTTFTLSLSNILPAPHPSYKMKNVCFKNNNIFIIELLELLRWIIKIPIAWSRYSLWALLIWGSMLNHLISIIPPLIKAPWLGVINIRDIESRLYQSSDSQNIKTKHRSQYPQYKSSQLWAGNNWTVC